MIVKAMDKPWPATCSRMWEMNFSIKLAAVPTLQAGSLACRVALGVLHWTWHPAHTSAEAFLASSVSLGLGIWSRSLEVASGFLVVLGPAFGSEPSTLGYGQLLALLY